MLSFCVTRSCLPVVPSSNRTKMRNIKLFGLWIKQKLLLPHIQNQPTNQPHNHHHLPPPLLLLKSSSTTAVVLPNKNTQSCLWWWSISLWLIDWLNDGCISMHILNVVCLLLLLPMSKWNRKLYDMIWWWFSIHPCYRCYLSIKSWCCYVFLKKKTIFQLLFVVVVLVSPLKQTPFTVLRLSHLPLKNIYIFCLLLNKKNENLIFLKTKIELPAHFWWNNTTFSNTFNSGIQHLNIVVDFCLFLNEKTKLTRNNWSNKRQIMQHNRIKFANTMHKQQMIHWKKINQISMRKMWTPSCLLKRDDSETDSLFVVCVCVRICYWVPTLQRENQLVFF